MLKLRCALQLLGVCGVKLTEVLSEIINIESAINRKKNFI